MFLVIGSTTLDLIHSGFAQMPVARGDEFTVDSLVFCDDPVQMRFGGNGANSAYVLAKLGASVALGSAIGQDSAGDLLYRPLVEIDVDTRGLVRHPTAATSVTTVISDYAQNRLSFHHAGSSHAYTPDALPRSLSEETSALLVASYTLFLRWRSQGFADLLQQVKAQGGITALDIGPAIGEPVTLAEIAFLLPHVDYFICNAHELAVCTAGNEQSDITTGMAAVLATGAGCVVTKCGAEGALVQRAGDSTHAKVPGFSTQVSGTVGAGDSFNAGFLFAVEQGQDAVAAAQFANATAALVLQSPRGVLDGPTSQDVEKLLNT